MANAIFDVPFTHERIKSLRYASMNGYAALDPFSVSGKLSHRAKPKSGFAALLKTQTPDNRREASKGQ
jgi:hypothetical protein